MVGRNRTIKIFNKLKIKKNIFKEKNIFMNMFNFISNYYKKTQLERNKLMLKNLSSLENLNNQYKKKINKQK